MVENIAGSSEKPIFDWEAPVRPYKVRGKEWFSTLATVVVLVGVVALLLGDLLLLGVIFSLAFVGYALSATPPQRVHHQILSQGLSFGGKLYSWAEMKRFWFRKMGEVPVLVIETTRRFPSQLLLLLEGVNQEDLRQFLGTKLTFVEAAPEDWIERSSHWFSGKLKLD